MCEATRKEARAPGNHSKDDLTKKPVCWGSGALEGLHPATEKQQAYGRFWLARFRESKIARRVGREARMAEMFQMLTDGVEVSCPAGLAASAWKPCLGDGSRQLWGDARNVSPGRYNGSESP